jgi:hypothetical protein
MSYTKNKVALGSANSNLTSLPYYVGDATYLTASVQTSTTSALAVTIQTSNADGFGGGSESTDLNLNSAGALWSTLTTITAAGLFNISPSVGAVNTSGIGVGFAWVRSTRSNIGTSAASNVTIKLNWVVGG